MLFDFKFLTYTFKTNIMSLVLPIVGSQQLNSQLESNSFKDVHAC